MIPAPESFAHFFDYEKWADLRQLESTKPLGDQAYFKDHGWSFGNIHKLMLHQLGAQSLWLNRILAQTPIWLPDEPRMAARSAVDPEWRAIPPRRTPFLSAPTPPSLPQVNRPPHSPGQTFTLPLWNPLLPGCNHS